MPHNQRMSMLAPVHQAAIRTVFALRHSRSSLGQYSRLLEETQWLSPLDIQAIQMRKLNTLLEHAYAHVPFYRRRFDEAGLKPEHIQTLNDLTRLPVLTKREIQDHLNNLLAIKGNRSQWRKNHTGGSTGHPLIFYQNPDYIAWEEADLLRGLHMIGYQLGMRWAFLRGSAYDSKTHAGWRGWLRDRILYNALWINTFDLTIDTLTEAARQLVHFQPQMLEVYVSAVTLLARLVRDRGIAGIRPGFIQTGSELLTPEDRQLIEETFTCPVFDHYGCREMGLIAKECTAHHGLHIMAESNLVEVLDADNQPAPPGTMGQMVVTNLNNYAMPFVRYEIGDMGVLSPTACSCGRGLPLLESVQGRTIDVITSPSGKLLHGAFFNTLLWKLSGLYQFRIIQETPADLCLQLVPGPTFNRQVSLTFLEEAIHRYGDPAFQVRFELCDHLPPAPSGKHRFIISHVPTQLKR
jgi:phenylacetate-CoA ligase